MLLNTELMCKKQGGKSWQTTQNGTSVSSAPIAGTTGKSLRIEAVEIVIS